TAEPYVRTVRALALSAVLFLLTAGCASMPWRAEQEAPPGADRILRDDTPAVPAPEPPPAVDRTREYALVALVDLAQRSNPETRESWEQARAAASRLGQAEAVYLP